jgi:hypothetical protein
LDAVYSIALITRGAGAFAYSYAGAAGLEPGRVVAVPFQHRLELGLVLGPDPDPPAKKLLSLVPASIERWPQWGRVLLDLCELSVSAPDELAGHLLFDSARKSLRLRLELTGASDESQALAALAGKLTPTAQKLLVKQWAPLVAAQRADAAMLIVSICADPDSTKAPAGWNKTYALSPEGEALLGLPQRASWPGSYLAGFDGVDVRKLNATKAALTSLTSPYESSKLQFAPEDLPPEWELTQHWPEISSLHIRTCTCNWPTLRSSDGLLAELVASVNAGQRVLVITPQAWLVERLWPVLAPKAEALSRYRAEAGPGVASQMLRQLNAGPHCVMGGPSAWKLAAYFAFDRVIVIDPTHPQFAAERTPHLDPRLALLLCASSDTKVDLINLGVNALQAIKPVRALHIHEPFDPEAVATPAATFVREDTDPLPLELRRPDKRRLIYFNRLGSGRGLFCAECWTAVNCTRCGSSRIHYSPAHVTYNCPECGMSDRDLRCPSCHLMTLVSVLPGLESVTRRPGDLILHGPVSADRIPAQLDSVIGTSHLLEPLAGFWPQQIVYVHAEGRVGLLADWPQAIDMALRLAALYDNAELEGVHIVSGRLVEQLGAAAGSEQVATAYRAELDLRELAGLPPFGTLYHLRATSSRSAALAEARQHLGKRLRALPDTVLLRIGTSFRQGGAHRLAGWLLNPRITLRELQELRWELHRMNAALTIHAIRGPWVW